MFQQTLKNAVSFEGNALHTGESVKVSLIPSEVNTGIVFVRTDLENTEIPALAKTSIVRIVKQSFKRGMLQ